MSFITAHETLGFVGSGDLLRVFKIGEKTEPKEAFSWDQLQPDLIKKPDFDEEKALKSVEKRHILCLAHSNTHHWLAVGTNEKQIHVIEYFLDSEGNFERSQHLITAIVPKAPTALAFDKEDAYIVVGDRAGDVHRFSISDGKAVELAGAISMVLDIGFTPSGKQLLMTDRDEKLRVMRYPETYVIDAYCLGHTEYVKTLACQTEDIVWTAGGDKKVYKWSISNPTEPLATVDLTEYNTAIRKIAYVEEHKRLAILLEEPQDRLIFADVSDVSDSKAHLSVFQILREGQYLDVTTVGDKFVVLGRDNIIVFEASDLRQQHVNVDEVLVKSLRACEDAVSNLYKNVSHQNQAEYEKRKAEKMEFLAEKKRKTEEVIAKHYPDAYKRMQDKK